MRMCAALLGLLLLGGLAGAAPFDKILLKNGSTLNGKVTADTGKSIVVEGNWGKETTLAYSEVDSRVLFRLKLGATKRTDGPGQIKLARFACDVGLWAQSRRHYSWALRADKSLESQVDAGLLHLRKTAGASVLADAKRYEAQGNLTKAQELLTTIIREIPHDDSAQEAAKMLITLHPRTKKKDSEGYEVKVSPRLKAMLAPARAHYDRMLSNSQKGESNLLFPDRALPYLNTAVRDGMQARQTWTQIKNRRGSDPELRNIVSYVDSKLDDNLVELHIHIASVRMRAKQYPGALNELTKATRIAPSDGRVSAMKMKIQYEQKVQKQRQKQHKAAQAQARRDQAYVDSFGYGNWGRLRNRRVFR